MKIDVVCLACWRDHFAREFGNIMGIDEQAEPATAVKTYWQFGGCDLCLFVDIIAQGWSLKRQRGG